MGTTPKLCFSRDSQVGSAKIPKIGTPSVLGADNFLCRPLIEMQFQEKL
jgi:hypothetical protein